MGKRVKQATTLKGVLGTALENLRQCTSDLLKTMLIFVPQYRLTLKVNLHWDVHIPTLRTRRESGTQVTHSQKSKNLSIYLIF